MSFALLVLIKINRATAAPSKTVLAVANIYQNRSITIDSSNMKIKPAGCDTATGAITGITVSGADKYSWVDEKNNEVGQSPDLLGVDAGAYQLIASSNSGEVLRTHIINIPTALPQNFTVNYADIQNATCGQHNGAITNVVINGGDPYAYEWVDSASRPIGNTKDIKSLNPGSYSLYLIDSNFCSQQATTVLIEEEKVPKVLNDSVIVEDDRCHSGTGAIENVMVDGQQPFSYYWYDGNYNQVGMTANLANIDSGKYFMVAQDAYGCIANSDTFYVNNYTKPPEKPVLSDVKIVRGMDAVLKVNNLFKGKYLLLNNNNDSNPLQENNLGEFTISGLQQDSKYYVINKLGDCESKPGEVNVKVEAGVSIYVPTAFSPNNDGQNDIFRPIMVGISALDFFAIYDRWGNKVFYSTSLDAAWNGSYKGEKASTGTYVWMLQGKDFKGNRWSREGTITLIR